MKIRLDVNPESYFGTQREITLFDVILGLLSPLYLSPVKLLDWLLFRIMEVM